MIQIDNTLITEDLAHKCFVCDLEQCKGACCVKGDAGAPLTTEEVLLLPKIIDRIKPYLRREGIEAIEQLGTHTIDSENETVTPLIQGKECAYVVFDRGIAYCAIEKAYLDGAITFRKPLSCHLYPIRIRKYEQFTAVNYDIWDICNPARKRSDKDRVPLHIFVKDALIRRFGNKWYQQFITVTRKSLKRDILVKKKADDSEINNY